jgi:hypothetical protein
MKIIFFDGAQSGVGVFFDAFHHCETRPRRPIFSLGKSQKSLGARSGGWVWHNRNVAFGQKLLNCHSRVTGCVIVMQRPVVLPFLRPFSPNTFAQMSQNFQLESSSNTCPHRYEFAVALQMAAFCESTKTGEGRSGG